VARTPALPASRERVGNSGSLRAWSDRDPKGSREVAVFSGGGTGGHLYPAMTLASGLQRLCPGIRPFFLGARGGLEARVLPERGFDHLLLPVQGFRRGAFLPNLGVLANLFRSLILAGEAFSRLRPVLVVVTGGFAGGPAGLMAGLMGIPLALQEQNAEPGVTTRILSRWSRQIHLAFPEARERLPARARGRAKVSGNPIRTPTRTDVGEARARFGLDPRARVVLIVGGSQGSLTLNETVLGMVQGMVAGPFRRPPDVQLLWGTGTAHLDRIKEELRAQGDPAWVRVQGYFHEMPRALDAATLAVSRSGAMATSELLAWGLPAVLVPLSTAAADHQSRNAESLEKAGVAVHLPEARLSPSSLWEAIQSLLTDPGRLEAMGRAATGWARPEATTSIVTDLATLLPRREGGSR